MAARVSIWTCIIALTGMLTYHFWPEARVTYPPGMLITSVPVQTPVAAPTVFEKEGYTITALASFSIRGRVLHRKNYSSGRESELSPVDFALGWREMSDQKVIDAISFDQFNRFYLWKTTTFPAPRRVIETNSANMHLIPADDDVADQLAEVQTGEVVLITGHLVEARAKDGWHWRSSLTREDTGNGACEVVWVERIEREEPAGQPD